MQDFKHILAWQRAHALAIGLHKQTRHFARAGHAHLMSQLTRAADAISTNIAEGCGAATKKEFARFLDISLFSPDEWQKFTGEIVEIRKMVYTYRKKVLQSGGQSD